MPSADSFDHVVDDLHRAYPALSRGAVERIVVEEHDLLVGFEPGDIVPRELRGAVDERLARLTGTESDGAVERA